MDYEEKRGLEEIAAELLAIIKKEYKNQIESDYCEIIHGVYEEAKGRRLLLLYEEQCVIWTQ